MTLRINGQLCDQPIPSGTTLLTLIRDRLRLMGTKESCGRGECGACTVLVNGKPTVSCIQFAELTEGDVTTVEGLAGESRDLREAFAEFGGFQCGFCTAGQIVHSSAILRRLAESPVDDPQLYIRKQLSGNICRCTGYNGIVDAVLHTLQRRLSGKSAAGDPR